jgi:DNA repair protein SbcC/Rad50
LGEHRKLEAIVIDKRSATQTKIDTLKELGKQKTDLIKQRAESARLSTTYETLAFSFSKKGIQALIIENTIPEIEEEANLLLKRLTNNQMNLRFITQKDQKTGGIIETLDLVIADGDLGDRKYELFSGGEAFRINFAVRIALSKLLARRAGARLETLVIDEGFGTQDEEGKEKLIEAIGAIKDDFKKIIVITHLDDLKELFSARIEVTKKRGLGSIVNVV